ncbi:MAG: tRNA pseudouridine(38-40) synthase TruA [Methanomassiliicoccales archaeon]|nr:tRNA pseudouridine(38-40) synthase TruA [Methanomassiliicoccales archaeon]
MVWRAAVKTAYDGRLFAGSQRQPDLPTVEGEIIKALKEINAIENEKSARFKAASRTDRGVSALGNVFAFDTDFRKSELLQALNSVAENLYFYAVAEAPIDFSPRRAKSRWYRYWLLNSDIDIDRLVKCAALFEGKHDFRQFCRYDGRSTIRIIDKITSSEYGSYVAIDFVARDFLWNMVRKIVSSMVMVASGKASIEEVKRALEGEPIDFGIAPAENLILMDVSYDIAFQVGRPITLVRKITQGKTDAFLKSHFFDRLDKIIGVSFHDNNSGLSKFPF